MTDAAYRDDRVTLYHGDCLDVLAELPNNSVDSVVTDPPYGLEFMGKDWDRPWAVSPTQSVGFAGRENNLTLPSFGDSRNANCRACGGRQRGKRRCDCATPNWDRDPAADMREFGQWCELWATECLRVLKPGGHLLAFGGTRTWHRLACAVEDAGFEIRDNIAWLYGSGFPKSMDVSKAIDKAAGAEREVVGFGQPRSTPIHGGGQSVGQPDPVTAPATDDAKRWAGWGTALKPAFEPIVVGRKPLSGTVAATVLAHGTGALNIDGCRVGTDQRVNQPGSTKPRNSMGDGWRDDALPTTCAGRWPSNVLIDDATAAEVDRQSGVSVSASKSSGSVPDMRGNNFNSGDKRLIERDTPAYGDTGGASRFFPTFRYQAKAPTDQRPTADGIAHPTVKPLDLMRWLVRLVTPPGGTVLEPFAGSGTTAEACIHEHLNCIAIEREADYLPLIIARLTKPMELGFNFDEGSDNG